MRGAIARLEPDAIAARLAKTGSPLALYGLLRLELQKSEASWRKADYWDDVVI